MKHQNPFLTSEEVQHAQKIGRGLAKISSVISPKLGVMGVKILSANKKWRFGKKVLRTAYEELSFKNDKVAHYYKLEGSRIAVEADKSYLNVTGVVLDATEALKYGSISKKKYDKILFGIHGGDRTAMTGAKGNRSICHVVETQAAAAMNILGMNGKEGCAQS